MPVGYRPLSGILLSGLGVVLLASACGRVVVQRSSSPAKITWHRNVAHILTISTAAQACRGLTEYINVNDDGNGQEFPRIWWDKVPWSDSLSKALSGPYAIHEIWLLPNRLLISGVSRKAPGVGVIGVSPDDQAEYGNFAHWQIWDAPGLGDIRILTVRNFWVGFRTKSGVRGVLYWPRGAWYRCLASGEAVPLVLQRR